MSIKKTFKRGKEKDVSEFTLDPKNWGRTKALGHKMLDDMMAYLQNIRSQPFNLPTEEVIKGICTPLILEGEGEEKVYLATGRIRADLCLLTTGQTSGCLIQLYNNNLDNKESVSIVLV